MSDALNKLRIFWQCFLLPAIYEWHQEAWSRDLDSAYCCDGRECGCYGATVRETFDTHPTAQQENPNE